MPNSFAFALRSFIYFHADLGLPTGDPGVDPRRTPTPPFKLTLLPIAPGVAGVAAPGGGRAPAGLATG